MREALQPSSCSTSLSFPLKLEKLPTNTGMKSVLIIDDDRALRGALATWLKGTGWKVLEAEDGDMGLQLAAEYQPDVVLCDLLMPRCNGFQVCRAIRQQQNCNPHTKIIVTTGSSYATDRVIAFEAGADEYLLKPIVPTDLSRLLERITGLNNGKDQTPNKPKEKPRQEATRLKFWGVRGSIPTPGKETVFYGGNTPCVEVRADGEIIILDAGTGIRPLGLALNTEFGEKPINLTILITHTHWDHIQGFPFFVPAYAAKNQIRMLGYEGARQGLESTLSSQMESPYFPITLRQMPGNIVIQELKEMDFSIGRVSLQAQLLNHPGICAGYRLNTSGGAICYLPDIELYQPQRQTKAPIKSEASGEFGKEQDAKLVSFIRDAEILVIDSQYDAQEYQTHIGWGHSCVEDSVKLAIKANVKRMFLFHHDPGHSDEQISRLVALARSVVARYNSDLIVEAAREGLELTLKPKSAEAAVEAR
jgi:phosphoribosyl 1,2-cyclic phosphodiesterase/FixJ family two-component response regulator